MGLILISLSLSIGTNSLECYPPTATCGKLVRLAAIRTAPFERERRTHAEEMQGCPSTSASLAPHWLVWGGRELIDPSPSPSINLKPVLGYVKPLFPSSQQVYPPYPVASELCFADTAGLTNHLFWGQEGICFSSRSQTGRGLGSFLPSYSILKT